LSVQRGTADGLKERFFEGPTTTTFTALTYGLACEASDNTCRPVRRGDLSLAANEQY